MSKLTIGYMSDLHLELPNSEVPDQKQIGEGDVLILAGDITKLSDLKDGQEAYEDFHELVERASENYNEILYVPGNHEFWGGVLDGMDIYRSYLPATDGFQLLSTENIANIEHVQFVGDTLWTDFENSSPIAIMTCESGFPDFYEIFKSGNRGQINAQDLIQNHARALEHIERCLQNGKDTVVITHHCPTYQCTPPTHVNSEFSAAYCNDLEYLFHEYENLKAWVCGHTHHRDVIKINNKPIYMNPRGYQIEKRLYKSFKPLYFTA